MIKKNIFFIASMANAILILLATYFIKDNVLISVYYEFLLLLQLITFCDLGLLSFTQRFSARINSGVHIFEFYGDDQQTQGSESVCLDLLKEFIKIIVVVFLLSAIFTYLFLSTLTSFGFFSAFSSVEFWYIITIGIGTQFFLLLINLLIGFEEFFLAKLVETFTSLIRIIIFTYFYQKHESLSIDIIYDTYLFTLAAFVFLLIVLIVRILIRLEFDNRKGNVNFQKSIAPFLLRNWIMTFFGFLFFNFTALYSTILPASNEKTFLLICTRFLNFARIYSQSEFLSCVPRLIKLNITNKQDELLKLFNRTLRGVFTRSLVSFSGIFALLFGYIVYLGIPFQFSIFSLIVLVYVHEIIQSSFAQLVLTRNHVPFVWPSLFSFSLAVGLSSLMSLKTVAEVLWLQYGVFLICNGWFSIFLAYKKFGWRIYSFMR